MKFKKILSLIKDPHAYGYVFIVIWAKVRSLPFYAWYITRFKQYKKLEKGLAPFYYDDGESEQRYNPFVVNIYDGKIIAGGLADRLRGILSTYYICKQVGKEFKLHFVYPFKLDNYLTPNLIDWRCSEEELCYNENYTSVLILDTTQDSPYQKRKQEKWLYKQICRATGQCHVYTNALFSYDYDYKQLFFELFKPSDSLQQTLDHYGSLLGDSYISISCRFLNLLGDFNETYGIKKPLTETEKKELIDKVIKEVEKLHARYPTQTILCNSDSVLFLKEADKLDYTYVVPGEITHIDGINSRDDYKMYEKTFVDFFLIANASHICLLKTGNMHHSGFPFAASKLYGRPFETIVF